MHEGDAIEELAEGNRLHPMQAAFIEHDRSHCGYCTPRGRSAPRSTC